MTQPRANSVARGRWAVVALLSTTLPAILGFNFMLPFGGGSLHYSDILVLGVAGSCLPAVARRRGVGLVQVLAAAAAAVIIIGLLHGAQTRWLLRDARPVIYTASGGVLGLYIIADRANWSWAIRATTYYLVGSAVLVVMSQLTSIAFVGAPEDAAIYIGGAETTLAARRTLISTDPLALLILCGIVGVGLAGLPLRQRLGSRTYWAMLISSAVIIFLSYSRNTFLGLGAAVLIGLLTPTPVPYLQRWLRALTIAIVVAVMVTPVASLIAGSGLFDAQINTYRDRVIARLSSSARASDSSAAWRATESRLAQDAIDQAPIIGHGLGVFYRPVIIGEPFNNAGGRLYVHNYYLWLRVKGGWLYMVLFVVIFSTALARLLLVDSAIAGEDRAIRVTIGCGIGAILAAAAVAPWPAQDNMAAVVGAIITTAWAIAPRTAGQASPTRLAPHGVSGT